MKSIVASKPKLVSSNVLEIKNLFFILHHPNHMKKNLFIAALLCSISFAGNATARKAKASTIEKKPVVSTKLINASRVCELYEITFDCPAQGWSIGCYGYTQLQAAQVYLYYQANLDC